MVIQATDGVAFSCWLWMHTYHAWKFRGWAFAFRTFTATKNAESAYMLWAARTGRAAYWPKYSIMLHVTKLKQESIDGICTKHETRSLKVLKLFWSNYHETSKRSFAQLYYVESVHIWVWSKKRIISRPELLWTSSMLFLECEDIWYHSVAPIPFTDHVPVLSIPQITIQYISQE